MAAPRSRERRKGGLTVKVTGAAGYAADALKVFEDINGTLLGLAALIVLMLLVLIYRSPIFWTIPITRSSSRSGYARGSATCSPRARDRQRPVGRDPGCPRVGCRNGYRCSSSAATARSCEAHRPPRGDGGGVEHRRTGDPRLRADRVLALLPLSLAEVNGTAGLGPIGALGIAVAMISMLTMLPALLVIFGRRAFWSPFFDTIRPSGSGPAAPGGGGGRRAYRLEPTEGLGGGTVLLVVLSLGVTQIDTGLTNATRSAATSSRCRAPELLARSFPERPVDAANIIVRDREKAARSLPAARPSRLGPSCCRPGRGRRARASRSC